MGPNWDPAAGPIGTLSEPQVLQVKAVSEAVGKSGAARKAK
jgi:hypothetical protein